MSDKRRHVVTHAPSGREFTLHMPTYGEMKAIEDETELWSHKYDVDRAWDKVRAAKEDVWKIKALDEGYEAAKAMREAAIEYQLRKIRAVASLTREEALALDNDQFYWLLGEIDAYRLGVVGDFAEKSSTPSVADSPSSTAPSSTPPTGEEILRSTTPSNSTKPVGPAQPGMGEWDSRRISFIDSN